MQNSNKLYVEKLMGGKYMGKIIEFPKDYKKSLYSTIIKELKNNRGKEYSMKDITSYANRILNESREFNPYRYHTLIVRIAQEFGIDTYIDDMILKLGFIKTYGDIKEKYKYSDKVIVISRKQEPYLQRLIIAYLLGCYLFKYLSSDASKNKEYFYAEYKSANVRQEMLAYRFAMDILMPRKLFVEQYQMAVKENASYYFVWRYLSKYFQVPESIVEKRIKEIAYF